MAGGIKMINYNLNFSEAKKRGLFVTLFPESRKSYSGEVKIIG